MLENKGIEKNRFSGLKGWTGQGFGQPAQLVKEPVDRLPLFDRGPVKECKKHSLSSSSFLFPVEVHPFPVEATVTYQSIKCSKAIAFCYFWLSSLKTYKYLHFIYEQENTWNQLSTYLFLTKKLSFLS